MVWGPKQRVPGLFNCCSSVWLSLPKGYIHDRRGKALFHSLPEMATRPDITAHGQSVLTQISGKAGRYQDFMQLRRTLYQLIDQAKRTPVRQFAASWALGSGGSAEEAKAAPRKRSAKKLASSMKPEAGR
ncbi:hypothetical protein ACLB1R_07795 [Escherichia coli]